MDKIGFGGGCHWCTEAVFQGLCGVDGVEQGFIRSLPPHDSFSEAVLVTFDSGQIDLATLIEIHLRTHASTSAHKMRGKYRSAVYAMSDAQQAAARAALDGLRPGFDPTPVTEVLMFDGFRASDARFQNYYQTDPSRPFCKTYIDPKLALLRRRFARHVG